MTTPRRRARSRSRVLFQRAASFDDDLGAESGSAYVYERASSGEWLLARKLLASNGAAGDIFGYSVAVIGSMVLVGAPGHSGALAGEGAVYVFERDAGGPGNWGEVAHFTAPAATEGESFGYSLAAHGNELLIGAPHTALAVPGKAYLYARDLASPSGWSFAHEFSASSPATGFNFGQAVALHEDTLAVSGAAAPGLVSEAGYHVHVRRRDAGGAGNWGQVQVIAPPDDQPTYFGYRLAVHGEFLAIVAPGELDSAQNTHGAVHLRRRDANGAEQWGFHRRLTLASPEPFLAEQLEMNADWLVAGAPSSGALFVFGRDVGHEDAFGLVARVVDPPPSSAQNLGQGLALEGHELVAGASGMYGSSLAGEAYVYDLARLARASWRNDAAGFNADSLSCVRPVLGTTLAVEVDLFSTGHAQAVLMAFDQQAETSLPGGQVLLGRHLLGLQVAAGPSARFALDLPLDPALCGRTVTLQALHRASGRPFALSNAQDLVLANQ